MTYSTIIPVFAGWIAGLLINYLADVLPKTRRLSPPSCNQCDARYQGLDYLTLTKCGNGHSRSWRTWFVQILSLSASVSIWYVPPEKLGYWPGMILTVYLGVVLFIDLEHRLILHPTSVAGAIIGLISGTLTHGFTDSILGGLGGFLIMLVFYLIGIGVARFRARRMRLAGLEPDDEEALGTGDVILVTILGLTLGWPLIWFCLLVGILLGGAISFLIVLWLVAKRRYGQNALMMFIPYGPYFIISAYVIIFFPGLVSRLLPA